MNVKPDELAWITGAQTPGLNGRVVTVLRRAVPGETLVLSDGEVIRVDDDRTADWIVSAGLPMPYKTICDTRMTTIRPIADRVLRPFRGLPQTETCEGEIHV